MPTGNRGRDLAAGRRIEGIPTTSREGTGDWYGRREEAETV